MKYDIITELKNKVKIENNNELNSFSKEQLDDLRIILSCYKVVPNSVRVGQEKERYTCGTIDIEDDMLDYEAEAKKQPYFKLSYENTSDEIITSIKFSYNTELLKVVKKIDNGLIIIEANNVLFKTGFQPVNDIAVSIKYYDNDALSYLKTGNYISSDMDLALANKGIVPDKIVECIIDKKEYSEWMYRFFNEPLNTYLSVMKYLKENNIFDMDTGDYSKVK